tara:strand:+ start:55 stop:675 length:621 start_codon:yes stop_codon:yes gene_type:complete
MNNFISVYDNALSQEDCKSIREFFEETSDCKNPQELMCKKIGMTGSRVDKSIKDSIDVPMSFNFSYNEINRIIMKSLASYTKKYVEENDELRRITTWGILDTYNLQRYYPNQGYLKTHCENWNMDTNRRVLVWMFFLNTVTDGGGTYFSNYDLKVDAVEGRLVIWPAYWTHCHKGIVSKSQTKYIATGWYEKIEASTVIRKVKRHL